MIGIVAISLLAMSLSGVLGVKADSVNFQVTVVNSDFNGWSGAGVEVWDGASLITSGNTNSEGNVFFSLSVGGPYEFRAGNASTTASASDIPDAVLVGVILMPTEMTASQPPVLDPIGDKTINEGELLSFTISATDPDGDPLTYSASNLPDGADFDPTTQTFSWTPGYDQAGSYPNVHFEVFDGSSTDSEDITIAVNNVGIQATVDIDPDTLNLKSKGQWITAYIELPGAYQPSQIDIATVKLNNVVPAVTDPKYDFVTNPGSYITDKDGDGVLERMVKFDRNAVQNLLVAGNNVVTISGRLLGWPAQPDFAGSDTIRAK